MVALDREAVDSWIKFTSTQAGRDKIYRLVQYGSRLVAYHLMPAQVAPELAVRISKLAVAVGLARKRRTRHWVGA